jgi:ABC-type arginine/histidine transport system permease subunit
VSPAIVISFPELVTFKPLEPAILIVSENVLLALSVIIDLILALSLAVVTVCANDVIVVLVSGLIYTHWEPLYTAKTLLSDT